MALYLLSENDRKLIKALLDKERSNPPSRNFDNEGEDYLAPETYIARPITTDGIPARTSEDDWDDEVLGSAECDIYRIDRNTKKLIEMINFSKTVYNILDMKILDEWIVIQRTKYGCWIAVQGLVECP